MAEYVVKLADERGRIQEQVQVAGSAEELRTRFSSAGYYVYSVRPRGMRGVLYFCFRQRSRIERRPNI